MTPDAQESRARERIGRVLEGKWRLERLLGMGGMAAVYAARHRNGARAAVKLLHPELARHAQLRERFLREGYAANRVEHPGAVAVLDDDVVEGGPDDGAAYIVMELLEGEVLEERAARAPLSERELLQVADSVLDVLAAAHGHGVIHRDLKPDNLFLPRTADGSLRVKVLDFGLARVAEGSRLQTRAGITLGTPAYMSPEQAAGRADEIDGRADLFSLGAVMFRLRTGKRVHEAASPLELVSKMANVPAPPIRDVDPSVSEAFAAIVDRAIAFRREERYADAAAMRADVRAALDALEPPTSPSTAGSRTAPPRSAPSRWIPLLSASVLVGVAAAWLASARFSPAPPRAHDEATSASALAEASAGGADAGDAAVESSDAAALAIAADAAPDALGDALSDALEDAEDAEDEEEEEEEDEEDAAVSPDAEAGAPLEPIGDAALDAEDAAHDVAVAKPKPPPATAHPTTKKPLVKPQPPPKKKAPTTTKKVKQKKRKKKRW
ncbi:MAG: serine/threonine protein kinase [Deltaproteobacteria bacterium]|nr:serine/threonine protein kinase [Deltaproteobacteria bacterium]